MTTPYHAKYYAAELTKRCSSHQLGKLNQSIFNATVDLNPHQIDAALFAFRSPLSRGAILADEVGLGKTIEAGLIISQLWAEHHRQILCIVPAALREQWSRELLEKFFIESVILESSNYNQMVKAGNARPIANIGKVVICSYHFARAKMADVERVPWDLVVVDEAHRLRNVYKKSNKIARAIRDAIAPRPKILLTATPLQNSLMELFGLVSFVDPHVFGSEDSFRELFAKRAGDMKDDDFARLKSRIQPICQRTLRRQVTEYIRYTNRVSLTQDFTPTDEEVRLYESVSTYLQRPDSFALPASQRSLMTLVLRKILASSTFAISATLAKLIERLEQTEREMAKESTSGDIEVLADDYEAVGELKDEWAETEETVAPQTPAIADAQQKALAKKLIKDEIEELKTYKGLATSITSNAKGQTLLVALKGGFKKAQELGSPHKALIFTESRRTQRYIHDLLVTNGYADQVVMLNGTNTEPQSLAIYREWIKRHQGEDCVKGFRNVDVRTALVDNFRDRAAIMVATESGAEGINLQFCSLVVNFDLPWNPQRIEQRIGRCHRYGQQHDVVVINFLNRRNAADQRVFELLSEKFRLFDGVFGASDEVLGALESGVDFEKRINDIYQSCRTTQEINAAFDKLQAELDEQISARMDDARSKLLEHFDEDVHTRLRISRDDTISQVSRFERQLWQLTQFELADYARCLEGEHAFDLTRVPPGLSNQIAPLGLYRLVTNLNGSEDHPYRLGHPLAQWLIQEAEKRHLEPSEVVFNYFSHPTKVSLVEKLSGKAGWLRVSKLTIQALETEDQFLFAAFDDDGTFYDADTCGKLLDIAGTVASKQQPDSATDTQLVSLTACAQDALLSLTTARNKDYFESEMDKLEAWSDDLKQGLEWELKDLDKEIKATKREAKHIQDLDAKVEFHKKAKDLERHRNEKRKALFDAQDEIDRRKEVLIGEIEARLNQSVEINELFTIRWRAT